MPLAHIPKIRVGAVKVTELGIGAFHQNGDQQNYYGALLLACCKAHRDQPSLCMNKTTVWLF